MEFMDSVMLSCSKRFGADDLEYINNAITTALHDFEITRKETSLAPYSDANEKMLQVFAVEMKVKGRSQITIKQYMWSTEKFLRSTGKNYKDITSNDVRFYFATITRKGNLKSTSMDNTRRFIRPFFTWLYKNKYISEDPFATIGMFKRDEVRKEILTSEEIVSLKDTCKNSPVDLAIVDFCVSTGVRVSELCNLNRDDVDFANSSVRVYATKTSKWRTVFLSTSARKHLTDYLNSRTDRNEALFVGRYGKRMSHQCVEHHLKIIGGNAGIHKRLTVHVFRKTCASILHAKGMSDIDIAEILGHSNVNTTVKYYIKTNVDDLHHSFAQCVA